MRALTCLPMRSASSNSLLVLITLLLFSPVHLGDEFIGVATASIEQQSQAPHYKFKRDISGRALKKGALEVSFARFKAQDGVLVERSVESYRSGQEARAALEKLTKRASKVIQRGYKSDANGRRVGPRVQLLFADSAGQPQETVIAWTDRRSVFVLRSQSGAHVLDFEQQDYPASLPKSPARRP